MKIVEAVLFFALAFFAAIGAIAAVFTPGQYDCGPYRQQFKILNCDARVCNIYTLDPGARGGGFASTMDLASLRTLLDSGAPGGTPCKMLRTASGVRTGSGILLNPPHAPHKAATVALGKYECYTMSSGHLYSAMSENFTIGGGGYVDAWGKSGTYSFAAGSQTIVFRGGALDGRRAVYKSGTPPLSRNPNNVTFLRPNGEMSDSCDGKV
ncbi:MAG: hypothetical protein GIW95_11330 [Candidatus Eremiobacteraeota bacterium]|nr:hypothetical protein [Candidatus Eremiobacteraeota bacterium]